MRCVTPQRSAHLKILTFDVQLTAAVSDCCATQSVHTYLPQEYSHSDSGAVTRILGHLSQTQRFSLSLSFLSTMERASLAELLNRIAAPDELRDTYGMP